MVIMQVKLMTMDTPIDDENPWYYKGSAFTTDDINDLFGFVYRITNLSTGKQYIGRKSVSYTHLRAHET